MTEVTCYTELIAAIEVQRQALGLKQTDFDELCGLAEGLWGKVAGQLQVRRLGPDKIFDALRGAGLRIRVEIDPEQHDRMTARIAGKYNPRNGNQARNGNHASPVSTAILSRIFKPLSIKANLARNRKLSKEKRSELARNAANVRWKRIRKRRRAAQRRRAAGTMCAG